MSDRTFERAVLDWLEEGSDRTPRPAIDAVLLAVKTTPQERGPWLPWRFRLMPALTRATGLAAVALVAAVGVGGLLYVNSTGPGGQGGQATVPPPTVAPTMAPTLPPGITGWKTYTSAVYGFTISYPNDWHVREPASKAWPAGDGIDELPYADKFENAAGLPGSENDGQEIGLLVWAMPVPAGVSVTSPSAMFLSYEKLRASIGGVRGGLFAPRPFCLGSFGSVGVDFPPPPPSEGTPAPLPEECRSALTSEIGYENDDGLYPHAFVGDPENGVVIVFRMAREDSFPAATNYGGTADLLNAILGELYAR